MIRKDRELRRRTEKELATLLVFEQMATPEMVQARDALLPAVLAWEEEQEPWQTRLRGPQPNSAFSRVVAFLKLNPWKTPSEIAKATGIERNKVSAACGYNRYKGRLQRESTNTVDRSGLPIWRYALTDEQDLAPKKTKRGLKPESEFRRVLSFLEKNPWKTPSEITRESGFNRNNVSRACIYFFKSGKLQREPAGMANRSGLPLWRYALAETEVEP